MKKYRVGKLLLAVLIVISMGGTLAIPTRATQSRSGNFNKEYSLTGNGAEDICRIALAQYLKTGSALGYSEAWCADFIGDCAKLAGQGGAIPANGSVSGIANNIRNAGGNFVSSPQKGDIAIISWDSSNSYSHAEIVYSVDGYGVHTIGGNSGRNTSSFYVSEVWKHTWPQSVGHVVCYLRPNYTSQSDNLAPIGNFDYAEGGEGNVTVCGWALDEDAPTVPLDIRIYIGTEAGGGGLSYTFKADVYRPDIENELPGVGNYHGFSATVDTSLTGEQTIYAYALDNETGDLRFIGSQTVTIQKKYIYAPIGNFDYAEGGEGNVTVCGWALDEDAPTVPLDIRIYIGTEAGGGGPSYTFKADVYRPDIENELPGVGNYHGFSATVDTSLTGEQIIYAYALDNETREHRFIGSQTVTIQKKCNHIYETVIVKNATCTTEGAQYKKCSKCGARTETVAISKTEHNYNLVVEKRATCAEVGSKCEKCSVCGTVKLGSRQTIPATGEHSYGSWIVTKAATVNASGIEQRTCQVCGKKETASIAKEKGVVQLNFTGTLPLKVKTKVSAKIIKITSGDKVKSWKSSNKSIATVDSKGKITGKKAGVAKITVTMKSGAKASFKVKVQNGNVKTTSIKLGISKTITLKKGKSLNINAQRYPVTSKEKITYYSSNNKVVTVTSKGIIKAVKAGKATITVKSGRKSLKVTVKVK